MTSEPNVNQHTAKYIMREVEAVVAKTDQPMATFGHWLQTTPGIGASVELPVEIGGRFVITRERIGIVLDVHGGVGDWYVVVLGAHTNSGWQRYGFGLSRPAGKKIQACK